MTKLILIRGNSASGKSSLAQNLQRRLGLNTLVLSQDLIRRTILNAKDGPDTPAIPMLIAMLETGRTTSQHIIVEGILPSGWYAPLWETIAELFAGEIYAYYYDLPFEETLRRHQTRPKAAEFGRESMESWWRPKDFLATIPETIITSDQSLEEVTEMILEDLGIV